MSCIRIFYLSFLCLSQSVVSAHDDALHKQPRHLPNVTQQILGKTSKQIIEERLVLEAICYLLYSNHPVNEIAHTLGSKDPSHSSKLFKKFTGVSPQSYK